MKLIDVVRRQAIPEPWAEGEKIPWNDPDFSRRMLQEHLSQDHDHASRRFAIIDKHVGWIHSLLLGRPARILDLGCGPGLYASRLARLGHECVGIDFSPASIAYAREQAQAENLRCTYLQQDIRVADYGAGYGLVLLIFGEFNVFSPIDARAILRKAHARWRRTVSCSWSRIPLQRCAEKGNGAPPGIPRPVGFSRPDHISASGRASGMPRAAWPPSAILSSTL